MTKPLLIVLSFLFLSFSGGEYKQIDGIPFNEVRWMTTDPLGNAYVIVGNQVLQFNSLAKPKANFSESSLGELRSVDASNPMKILLFYPDFSKLIFLNAQLAIQGTIHLREAGIQQATVACNSLNGGAWVFDKQDFELKKIDLNLQLAYQSGNMITITGVNVNPDFMMEYDSYVYLNDPLNGVFVFDRYGTYIKTIPLQIRKSFQIIDNELLYLNGNKLMAYHLKSLAEREILLPPAEHAICARIENQELYLLTSDTLAFYSF